MSQERGTPAPVCNRLLVLICQSRPDSGLGLSHFLVKVLKMLDSFLLRLAVTPLLVAIVAPHQQKEVFENMRSDVFENMQSEIVFENMRSEIRRS